MSGEEPPVPPFVCFTKAQCGVTVSQHSGVVNCGSLRCGPCVLVLSVSCGCCQAVPILVEVQTQPRVPVGAKRACWSVSNKVCVAGFGGSGTIMCRRCQGRRSFQKRGVTCCGVRGGRRGL